MSYSTGLLVLRAFFSLCALLNLFNLLKPSIAVKFVAKWFEFESRLFGYDAEVKPTPRAMTICRILSFFSFVVFMVMLLVIK